MLSNPIRPVIQLAKAFALLVFITELAAGQSDDFHREMVSNSVNMMG